MGRGLGAFTWLADPRGEAIWRYVAWGQGARGGYTATGAGTRQRAREDGAPRG